MGLLDFVGNITSGIGKWQYDMGIDTPLSRGYLMREMKKKNSLVEPLIAAAKRDMFGSISANPDYDIRNSIPKPEGIKERTESAVIKSAMPDINFAPQYSDKNKFTFNAADYLPAPQNGLASALNNVSPITYNAPLSTPELMRKHAVAFSLAGVKPEALQMGMMTPEENYRAALVKHNLALSAAEDAELRRKYGNDLVDKLYKAGLLTNKAVETGTKYGTENNNLVDITNEIIGSFGVQKPFTMDKTPGLETQKTQAYVNRQNAAANASDSVAWRNYNKPFFSPNTGAGQYDRTQISLALKDINAHQQAVRAAMRNALPGEDIDETKLPTYPAYVQAQNYLNGVKQYGPANSQPTQTNPYDGMSPVMRDFAVALNNHIQTYGAEAARQWINQNRDALLAKGIDPDVALTWIP
ncbi:hypothetical protein TcarDRAFT_1292 [Thermosinus carboxydivorans Nor1]|uniref:Uncharacterized protein n=1 Tax=Thermosinus carboxydivorans Nor1 TaxID=401526 RepID=A1HR60_9FIRM|nr:hypothetical protein [Thermosinus carboxydivorans]EAX47557.1 hypothetical protein TcarDRAFT_1292 [Thermosinus carboxydivorans Nor1]